MPAKPIRITFVLDESDSAYFRTLYRDAKRDAADQDAARIVEIVRCMIKKVRSQKKRPSYMDEAVDTLEALIGMLQDAEWAMPKNESAAVIAGLSYFANPKDLVPDEIPGLGFLDDAIMIRLVEEEFEHDIWGYRKFRTAIENLEHRPWTAVARQRLPGRVAEIRKAVRADIAKRKSREGEKRRFLW